MFGLLLGNAHFPRGGAGVSTPITSGGIPSSLRPDLLDGIAAFFADDDAPGEPRLAPGGISEQVDRHAAMARAVLPESLDTDKLGCEQSARLLFGKCSSDGANEILARKLFAALFRGTHRARFGDLAFAYAYARAEWSRITSLP